MKKHIWVCVIAAVILLLALTGFLLTRFLNLYRNDAETESGADAQNVLSYARENWGSYHMVYDPELTLLTLTKQTSTSYDSACRFGGEVYTDALAPESFLPEVRLIAADVAATCDVPGLEVLLQYTAESDEVIFSVHSDGTIFHCWDSTS